MEGILRLMSEWGEGFLLIVFRHNIISFPTVNVIFLFWFLLGGDAAVISLVLLWFCVAGSANGQVKLTRSGLGCQLHTVLSKHLWVQGETCNTREHKTGDPTRNKVPLMCPRNTPWEAQMPRRWGCTTPTLLQSEDFSGNLWLEIVVFPKAKVFTAWGK